MSGALWDRFTDTVVCPLLIFFLFEGDMGRVSLPLRYTFRRSDSNDDLQSLRGTHDL